MDSIPEVDLEKAKSLLEADSATFVDVRDPGSYAESHIPGACNILDDTVEDFVAKTPKDRPLVVYCYFGHTSLGGAAYFLEQGFSEVYSMEGGFESWRVVYPESRENSGTP